MADTQPLAVQLCLCCHLIKGLQQVENGGDSWEVKGGEKRKMESFFERELQQADSAGRVVLAITRNKTCTELADGGRNW